MTTTTLALGAVVAATGSPTIVGDPPQWSDGSDATYSDQPAAASKAQAEPVRGNMTAWTVTVRAASEPGVGPDPVFLQALLLHDGGDAFLLGEDLWLPNDGSIHEISAQGAAEYVNDPASNPSGWLAAGPSIQIANGFGTHVYIYEVTVTVTVTDERATRLWPRDDALGLGAGARIYPPPRSRRLVGGQP